jgi:hypothetical protein
MFLNYILVPYIVKNFSDYNCYQLNIHLRQSFKYSGAILLCIVWIFGISCRSVRGNDTSSCDVTETDDASWINNVSDSSQHRAMFGYVLISDQLQYNVNNLHIVLIVFLKGHYLPKLLPIKTIRYDWCLNKAHHPSPWRRTKKCHSPLHYDRKFQIFIFLIGYINVNNGVFCLIISYLRIKSYNVLNYNNYSTDWSFPLQFA